MPLPASALPLHTVMDHIVDTTLNRAATDRITSDVNFRAIMYQ